MQISGTRAEIPHTAPTVMKGILSSLLFLFFVPSAFSLFLLLAFLETVVCFPAYVYFFPLNLKHTPTFGDSPVTAAML
jgi:hypothetical protein